MSLNDELIKIHAELAPHFNPAILQREATVFQMIFDTGDAFYLTVDPQKFEFTKGSSPDPTLTLIIDRHETLWDLLKGKADSMAAFMDGRYRADGNIVLSQLLLYLFANNDPVVAYEVQD